MLKKFVLIPPLVLMFGLVVYKAFHLSFTHDEALTYSIIKDNDCLQLSTNNHLLNTWLMFVCSSLFGDSEISLRLPNLLSFGLYIVFAYKLFSKGSLSIALLAGIPLLFFNTYFLDFFCLARGYGLSAGLMSLAIYFLIQPAGPMRSYSHSLICSILFAALATLANMNLVNFYMGVCLISVMRFFENENWKTKKTTLFITLFFAIAFLSAVIYRLLSFKSSNQLYFGAESLEESLTSLCIWSINFSFAPVQGLLVFKWIIKISMLVIIICTMFRKAFRSRTFKMLLLWGIVIAGLVFERLFFGIPYPRDRVAIYLIPFFTVLVFCFLQDLNLEAGSKKLQIGFMILIGLVLTWPLSNHFRSNFNAFQVTEWGYDANTKNAVLLINENKSAADTVQMQCSWLFKPVCNYYIQSLELKIKNSRIENEVAVDAETDYVYEFTDAFKDTCFNRIKVFENTGSSVFERKK